MNNLEDFGVTPRTKAPLNYSDYKRQNELKLIEEMSKNLDIGSRQASHDALVVEEKDINTEFFKTLDILLKKFVFSVNQLKNAHDQYLKEEFINATSNVFARADEFMQEIADFEYLREYPEELSLSQADAERLEKQGIKIDALSFPCPLKPFYFRAFEDVRTSAQYLMLKGKNASVALPPPSSAAEMLQATIPCVISIKKLLIIAKESTNKAREIISEERRTRENWRKERLQIERVQKLYQVWEGIQVEDDTYNSKSDSELTKDELKLLEDPVDGLVIESINSTKIIRGGRLQRLVEAATNIGHKGLRSEKQIF